MFLEKHITVLIYIIYIINHLNWSKIKQVIKKSIGFLKLFKQLIILCEQSSYKMNGCWQIFPSDDFDCNAVEITGSSTTIFILLLNTSYIILLQKYFSCIAKMTFFSKCYILTDLLGMKCEF